MRRALVALGALLPLASACGPGGTASPGGVSATCSPQAQQLAFAGPVSGSLKCTGSAVQCKATAFGHGYSAHIEGDVGRRGVVLEITVGGAPGRDYHGPGSYATGAEQTEPAGGVRLTAGGGGSGSDWRSEGGGAVVVVSDKPSAIAGSLDLTLLGYGGQTERVSGAWSCAKA